MQMMLLSVCDLYITDCNGADPGDEVCSAAELRSIGCNNEQLKPASCP